MPTAAKSRQRYFRRAFPDRMLPPLTSGVAASGPDSATSSMQVVKLEPPDYASSASPLCQKTFTRRAQPALCPVSRVEEFGGKYRDQIVYDRSLAPHLSRPFHLTSPAKGPTNVRGNMGCLQRGGDCPSPTPSHDRNRPQQKKDTLPA